VKNHKTYKFPQWLSEIEDEKINAKAEHGILVVKPNGVGLRNKVYGGSHASCRNG
jgi:hypothetical protein